MFSCICFTNRACNREDDVSSESQLVAGKHPIHPTTNFLPTQSDEVALSSIEPSRIGQLEVPPLHALCVHVLAESPSIIGIFSDSPDGRVVYQNVKSFEYYGDLGKAKADAPSTFPHILNSLLSYERSHEINVTSLLSELNATGLWSGSIKVPQRLHPGPQEKEDMPSPAGQMKSYEASLSPLPSPYAKAQSSPLGSGQETDLSNSHSRGQGSNTVPLDVVQVTAYSASFRKAPKKVKSLLMPGFQALLSGTNGSINSRHDGDPPLGSTSKYCRTNSLLDRPPINSSSSKLANSSSGRNLLRSKTLSGKELSPSTSFIPPVLSNIVEAALEAQIPQLVINNAASNPMARPPRVPSEAIEFESINLNSALKTWDEADPEEGLMISTFESLNKSTTSPFQWHDLTIKKIKSPVTGEPLIVMTQSDVTVRVAMEKAMLDCANTQLKMVSSIFPLHVVEFFNQQRDMKKRTAREMEADIGQLARSHKGVTILFMDIVGFTSMSKEVPPTVVMKFLNNLFGRFDRLLEEHNVQKVETAGDCYIVASGVLAVAADGSSEVLSSHDPQVSASRVLSFAQAMLRHSKMMKMPHNGEPVLIRIGIHTGDCVSGLVGSTLHKFGLFGDTMNTASRMESTSIPGRIQISASTYSMLPTDQQGQFEATSGVEVKGKGLMQTYLWVESSMIDIVESPSARYQKQSTLLAMTQAYNDAFSLFHSTSSFKRLSPFCGQAIEGQSQAPPDIPSRKSFDTRQVRKFASQPQAAQPVGLAFHSHRPDNDLDS